MIKRSKNRVLKKEYVEYRSRNIKLKDKINSKNYNKSNINIDTKHKGMKNRKITKFETRRSNKEFDASINYYIEYWKMFNENEFILAKIKENLYEINNMKGHLQELNNINDKK